MMVVVEVMPKEGILDPQGQAVRHALHQLGYQDVRQVQVGKRIVLDLDTGDAESALEKACEMAEKLLHNENVESYRVLPGDGVSP
ncbi:MAG: phosphoribosylformylglycinamidine synthase subunit PurS [bacterium]